MLYIIKTLRLSISLAVKVLIPYRKEFITINGIISVYYHIKYVSNEIFQYSFTINTKERHMYQSY